MLLHSFGAGNFAGFWKYWNPIWGFYLGKYIYKPLEKRMPRAFSLLLTFAFCGFLHDLVIMLLRRDFALLFTPWFSAMALFIVISEVFNISYSSYSLGVRILINLTSIVICFALTYPVQL